MLDECQFDPETGAPLTETKAYPPSEYAPLTGIEYQSGVRTPVRHHDSPWHSGREGALTNGELTSSTQGLIGYFRRVHRTVRSEPEPGLDSAAASAFKKVKATDQGANSIDAFVWYTVAEHLAHRGFWVAWMLENAIPRCPLCYSRLKFRPAVDGLEGICASSPSLHGAVDGQISGEVKSIYEAAFDKPYEPLLLPEGTGI